MAYTTDAAGYRTYTKPVGDRDIYVNSNTGNNSTALVNDATKPYLTLAAAFAQWRSGTSDRIHCARNSEWDEAFPTINNANSRAGRSAAEPLIIDAYTASGDANTDPCPIIRNPVGSANDACLNFETNSAETRHIFFQSIHLQSRGSEAGTGIRSYTTGRGFRFEDCEFSGFNIGATFTGEAVKPFDDAEFYRCRFIDNYTDTTTGKGQGFYSNCVGILTFDRCIAIHNGRGNILCHGFYVDEILPVHQATAAVIFTNNIVANDIKAATGAQLRPGGTNYNNLFVGCAIGLQTGSGGLSNGSDRDRNAPSSTNTTHNIFIYAREGIVDVNTDRRGWGIISRWNWAGSISDNLFIEPRYSTDDPRALYLQNDYGTEVARGGNRNLTIQRNVFCDWGYAIGVEGGPTKTFNNNLSDNIFLIRAGNFTQCFLFDSAISTQLTPSNNTYFITGKTPTSGAFATRNYPSSASTVTYSQWVSLTNDTTSSWSSAPLPTGSSLVAYCTSIGVSVADAAAAYAHLVSQWRLERRYNHNPLYDVTTITDFIRARYGRPTIGTPTTDAPTASAGSPQSLTDSNRSGSDPFTLDATGSTADSPATLTSYLWKEGSTTIYSGTSATPSVTLSLGVHPLTLTVTDSVGLTSLPANVTHTLTPTTPTGLSSGTPTPTGATLSHTAYPGVTSTDFQYGLTASYGSTAAATGSSSVTIGSLTPSTTYHWRARVNGPSVSSAWSADQTFTTAAVVNNAPTAVATTPTSTVIDSDRDGSHVVQFSGVGSSDPESAALTYSWVYNGSVISTAQTFTYSLPLGTHTLTLTVSDPGALTSTASVSVTVLPGSTIGLSATSITDTGANLSVTAYPTATSYLFEYGTTLFDNPVTTTSPNLTLTGLTPNTQYRARCTPLFGSLTGFPGSPIFFQTLDTTPTPVNPTANAGPDQIIVDSNFDGSATFSLDGSGSTDPDGSIDTYNWTMETETLSDEYLGVNPSITLPLGVYTFILSVTDDSGLTSLPDICNVIINPGSPVPSALVSTDTLSITVPLYPVATAYEYAITTTSGSYLSTTQVPSNTYTFTSLLPTTTYYYRTRIHYGALRSEWSNEQSITTTTPVVTTGPTAALSPSPTHTEEADTYNGTYTLPFAASLSTAGSSPITTYSWYVNGVLYQSGTSNDFVSVLPVGSHLIYLLVTDANGLTSSAKCTYTVTNPTRPTPPSAVITGTTTATASSDTLLGSITLSASSSTGTDPHYRWYWNGALISGSVTLARSFPIGSHNITLIVGDDFAQESTASTTVTISPPSPSLDVSNINTRPRTLPNVIDAWTLPVPAKKVRNVFQPPSPPAT